ncbi:MAG TPA: hypothetical protein VIM42_08165 [Clostridium sp.]
MPVLSIVTVLACIYLMSALPILTWISFVVWLCKIIKGL